MDENSGQSAGKCPVVGGLADRTTFVLAGDEP